jgi:uncharacterized protein
MLNATPQKRVLITGASGLVGRLLTKELVAKDYSVLKLVRNNEGLKDDERYWNPEQGVLDKNTLNNIHAIIHLAGENIVSQRWTSKFKQKIRDSRIKSTTLLSRTLSEHPSPPTTFISASAIGFYGHREDEALDETSKAGTGFLAELAKEWEAAAYLHNNQKIRTINLRISVVLSKEGGALSRMLTPFKLGLGGPLGDGSQYMSWITNLDLAKSIVFCLENAELSGPVNACAPQPETNLVFTKTLAKALKRPAFFALPKFAARLVFGEFADEALFASAKIFPKKLIEAGFVFTNPNLESAIRDCI